MGVTEYPCPRCGTPQKVRAPNGQEVKQALCAACTEQVEKEKEQPRDHNEEAQQLAQEGNKKARTR